MRKFLIILLIAMLAMVLVACDSGDNTVTLADGGKMTYPNGWVTRTEDTMGMLLFASEQSLLDDMGSGQTELKPGQAGFAYLAQPVENMNTTNLSEMASNMSMGMENIETSELVINGNYALSVTGQSTSDTKVGVYILLIKNEENNIIMIFSGNSAPGEQSALAETIRNIAESYTPANE